MPRQYRRHGLVRTYKYLGCRCARCRKANADYQALENSHRNARLKQAPHGTVSGYTNWGCRCDGCKEAKSAYDAKRREAAKVAA